jgi:hypothetical protein
MGIQILWSVERMLDMRDIVGGEGRGCPCTRGRCHAWGVVDWVGFDWHDLEHPNGVLFKCCQTHLDLLCQLRMSRD